ncbi:MAG: dynamin family protein [Methylococcaceae bacterium]|nr:dynamin family protein [Methylococcaceae bacterium]
MSIIIQLQEKLHDYGQWREQMIRALDGYKKWLDTYDPGNDQVNESILHTSDNLRNDRLVVAFAAEFSRGKTELINALFFSDTGVRLLPSQPGRTTMCPTEIFYDPQGGSYIRLLPIETRLSDVTLSEHKQRPFGWLQIDLNHNSPVQMQEAFQELAATKKVSYEEAIRLGLYCEDIHATHSTPPEIVEIPCWRHALISFPHHLLKEGLSILDTPGLNALGAEPELTLRMLPSAQAVIFVLAADTGVTKSDLDMWNNHVRGSRHGGKKGLAVAMNKIDSMWDDLHGEEGIEKSIRSQVAETSKILGVDESLIFPVSAKQALLAKVKRDAVLLEKSRLKKIEDYLANTVIRDRQTLLREAVTESIGRLLDESLGHLEIEVFEAEHQLDGMRKLDVKNQDMTRQLMEETREQQTRYLASVDSFQAGRRVFVVQIRLLVEAISPATIDPIVRTTRKQMAASLTTVGMKTVMKKVLEDLHLTMEKAMGLAEETRRLLRAIYGRFETEHGFDDLKPAPFSLRSYQVELERIFLEGEEFRHSASSTLMEQNTVVHKLYGTLIAEARDLFGQAHQEAAGWGASALSPLVRRIKDRKRMIESRLEVLRKVNESSETLDEEIGELERKLAPLQKQYRELKEIQQIIEAPSETATDEPAPIAMAAGS